MKGFSETVREQQKLVACVELDLTLRIGRVSKRPYDQSALFQSNEFTAAAHQQRRIVPGVRERDSALLYVNNAVETTDELVQWRVPEHDLVKTSTQFTRRNTLCRNLLKHGLHVRH